MLKYPVFALALLASSAAAADITISGSMKKWHPIIIDNTGPTGTLNENLYQPNPFLDYRYNVKFTSPSGTEYTVPGYFAGNGLGGGTGSVWRAKFSADEVGQWQYQILFRRGDNIAVSLIADEGDTVPSDGETGHFTITPQSADDPGFLSSGRLQYDGTHYLKFADGPYWIKGGVDSPENFMGYAGFDNTVDHPGGAGTNTMADGVHRYESHTADWQDGDPLFTNSANPEGAKAILGAINYLASEQVNSIYFLPMNLGGDGRETYPFINTSGSDHDNTHYDISKLFQWSIVLDHMQNKGIATNIVLAEIEAGNTNWLDDGQLGTQRKLYYRELIARFSHLLGLKWNISEESRLGDERHIAFAEYIRQLDWAEHPISVHTEVDRPDRQYNGLLGNPAFDASSIQFSAENADLYVETWRARSAEAGWPWVIDMDEVAPGRTGLTDSNIDELRKSVLYPVYFSGGNTEWYFGYHLLPLGGDMRTEDFRTREPMYRYMLYARTLLETETPFWEMEPADELHSAGATTGVQVFAKEGAVYAVYLPSATETGQLTVVEGEYEQRWFNPRTGEFAGGTITTTTNPIELGAAPDTAEEDWVVIVKAPGYVLPDVIPEPDPEPEDVDNTDTDDKTQAPAGQPTTDTPVLGNATPKSGGSADPYFFALLFFLAAVVSRRKVR